MREKELENLPVVDMQLGLKLVSFKQDLADDILNILVEKLPEDMAAIKALFAEKQYQAMHQKIHYLHGALCYCGTPRMKKIVEWLESDLKNKKQDNLAHLINLLDKEANQLIAYHARMREKKAS